MVTHAWLLQHGNAAVRRIQAAHPALHVAVAIGPQRNIAKLVWVDGPARTDVDRHLRTQYQVRHLHDARLQCVRRLSLPTLADLLLRHPYPPPTVRGAEHVLRDRAVDAPSALASLVIAMFAVEHPVRDPRHNPSPGAVDLVRWQASWSERDGEYRALRAWLTPERRTAAEAALAACAPNPATDADPTGTGTGT